MNKEITPPMGDCNLGEKWEEHEIIEFFQCPTIIRLPHCRKWSHCHQGLYAHQRIWQTRIQYRSHHQKGIHIIQNKSYLARPSASASDLGAIMADFYQTLALIQFSVKPTEILMECHEKIKVQPVLKSFSGDGAFKRNFIPYKPTIVQSKSFNRAVSLMVSVPSKRCAISSSWKLKKQPEVSTQKRGVLSRKGLGNVEVSLFILDSKTSKEIEFLSP